MTPRNREAYHRLVSEALGLLRDGFRRPIDEVAFEETLESATSPAMLLGEIAATVETCQLCDLCKTRTRTVPGEGVQDPLVLVVGEGPGADEDASGRPFVGRAGQYLDKWLDAIQLDRKINCFIANIVKCRPPGNRDPDPGEREACIAYLDRQIDALSPRGILTLGRVAIQTLLGSSRGIGALRGRTYEYRGVPVIPTYHPSGVLRNPAYRKDVWDDLRRLQSLITDSDE